MVAWKQHVLRISAQTQEFDDTPDRIDDLRRRIEPWLSSIFQAEHLNFMLGSGFTIGVAGAAKVDALDMSMITFGCPFEDKVNAAAAALALATGRAAANIEDQLNAALTLEAGLRIQDEPNADVWRDAIHARLTEFMHGILATEAAIETAIDSASSEGAAALDLLVSFLLTLASRTASRERPHLFTTNYDRLIEYGCDLVGLRILDRFVGTLIPRFRSSRVDIDYHYNPPGIRGEPRYLEGVVKLTKLHGSIDWRQSAAGIHREPLPFGAPADHPGASAGHEDALLIYPNSGKELATAAHPYADLLRDFSSSISRPNSVLATYGYGFGDEHFNRVISDMLAIPSTHLLIISWDDANGRIKRFCESTNEGQISLLLGPHFGDLSVLVHEYLPKPAIDLITSRMTEMLRKRAVPQEPPPPAAVEAEADAIVEAPE